MFKNWYHNFKNNIKHFNFRKDNRPFIFVVCVLIASLLWLVSAMGKRYETTVSMPIQYTNLPKDKILVNAPPAKVDVTLEGYGFTLLRHKIQLTINPINFNLRLFTNNQMGRSEDTELPIKLSNYIPQISRQISAEINILDIAPETIVFHFDQLVSVKKRVTPNFDLSFQNQYFLLDSVKFIPDSVLVTGPKSLVDSIKTITTIHQRFKDINATVREKRIKLQKPDQVVIAPGRVATEIPVSLYTEYTQEIPLSKINVPDSINLVLFPGRVKIKCIVAVDNYPNLTPSGFILGIDFNNLNPETNKFPVIVYRSPAFIKSLSIYPLEVEYLIEKN